MATLAQNIQRAINDFNSIENAIVQKGVPVPDGTPTSEYGEKILSIETGVDTSGDTVVPSALREGFTAHDAAGQEITGTIPNYDGGNTVEMTSPEGATLNTAGKYCEGNIEVVPKLQEKTATTGEIVTADDGYVGLESVDTNPVFEAGKKSEYDAFWDSIEPFMQGPRPYLFAGNAWNDITFKPKSDMIPSGNADGYFYNNGCNADLVALLDELGVILDTSKVKSISFTYSSFARLGLLDFSSAANVSMGHMKNLKTIDKIVLSEGCLISMNGNTSLASLTIEGKIGQKGLNVSSSPLNKASLTSIVNALSATTTGLTVTLRLAAVNTAFETTAGAADGSTSDEWTALIATKPNWTINLINS